MTWQDVNAEAIAKKLFSPTWQVSLLRQERYNVPVYEHWWQGWSWSRVRHWVLEPVYLWSEDEWDGGDLDEDLPIVGYKLTHLPLSALLRPVQAKLRYVEASERQMVTARREGAVISMGPVAFEPSLWWSGQCTAVKLFDLESREIGQCSIGPIEVFPGHQVVLTSLEMEIS